MVAVSKFWLAWATVADSALRHVLASGFEYNPVTEVADVIPLNKVHPARAAMLSVDIPVEAKPDPAEVASNRSHLRNLEVTMTTSRDIGRLERHFGVPMEMNLGVLASQYHKATYEPVPWPASYWPMFRDSINYRWDQNEPSPAEKYAVAYGKDVKQFMDSISWSSGILSQTNNGARRCTSNSDCQDAACAIRENEKEGFCIPTWFGICHAWAPAAILEPEPKCAVTKGNVTFKVNDMKALITQLYDDANLQTVFTGARYNGPSDDKKDEYGRFVDNARRDLGAGYFHVAMTNLLGKHKTSFVIDVAADAPVWNQPVRGYEVVELDMMTPSTAAERFFNVAEYPFNDKATMIAKVTARVSWIYERVEDGPWVPDRVDQATMTKEYEYLLELDDAETILGGEWVGQSLTEHPDFLWLPEGKPALDTVTTYGLSYRDIQELLEQSVACEDSTPTPTQTPTSTPTQAPSAIPTPTPSSSTTPTSSPSPLPSPTPTSTPTATPSVVPSASPSNAPTSGPTSSPTSSPSESPSASPTAEPSLEPTLEPSSAPSPVPTSSPSSTPCAGDKNSHDKGGHANQQRQEDIFVPKESKIGQEHPGKPVPEPPRTQRPHGHAPAPAPAPAPSPQATPSATATENQGGEQHRATPSPTVPTSTPPTWPSKQAC